jgi:diguanylate cyclase (GGDEF)-like protein
MGLMPLTTLADLPRRAKILVVGQELSITAAAQHTLGTDCEVLTASDGPIALELCTKTHPDLVLLDDALPEPGCLQVLAQLRAVPSLHTIPIILLTSNADADHETAGLDAGAADLVTKPVNNSVLRVRVTTQLLLGFQAAQLRAGGFRDGLTGVYGRRYLEEQIGVEFARAKRNGKVLSLLMIDIDHFNAYNDYYGYQAGDDALRLVARVLESKLRRPDDLVARHGSDEFVCVLPATDFEPAMDLAEQVEQAVRARAIGHASSSAAPVVTISVGVATRRRAIDGGSEALLRLAHEQLDQAKQRGRARVCGKVLY